MYFSKTHYIQNHYQKIYFTALWNEIDMNAWSNRNIDFISESKLIRLLQRESSLRYDYCRYFKNMLIQHSPHFMFMLLFLNILNSANKH